MTPDDREDKIERDMFGHGWGSGIGGPPPDGCWVVFFGIVGAIVFGGLYWLLK